MEAVKWFTQAAEQGEVDAAYYLAKAYETGKGVKESPEDAQLWYQKAADLGYPPAQFSVGLMYYMGSNGMKHDYEEAIKWYKLAAQRGLSDAQNSLGVIYWEGHGVPVNLPEAARWFTVASEQGNFGAQANLATLYRYGLGVKQDPTLAYKWYTISANSAQAQGNIGMKGAAEISRNKMAEKMTPEQIQHAREQAFAWIEKHDANAPGVNSGN
jgi:hypothetical protein